MTQVCLYFRLSQTNKTAQSHPPMPAHPRPHRHDCAIATETPPRRDTHIVLVLLVLGLLLRLVRLDFLGSLASGVLDLLHSVCGSAHKATSIQPSCMCPRTISRASIHPPARFDAHVPCIERVSSRQQLRLLLLVYASQAFTPTVAVQDVPERTASTHTALPSEPPWQPPSQPRAASEFLASWRPEY